MSELETIYNSGKDTQSWIDQADQNIKELEDNFGNKDVIQSVHKHNELLKRITSTLAGFFL